MGGSASTSPERGFVRDLGLPVRCKFTDHAGVAIQFDPDLTPVADLLHAAQTHPHETFVSIEGESATYAEAARAVLAVKQGLVEAGVLPGDRVLIVSPNRIEALWAWLGIQAAGAIDAPISVEAPGAFLRYLVTDLQPKAAIATGDMLARLRETVGVPIDLAVVIGPGIEELPLGPECRHLAFDDLLATPTLEPTQTNLPGSDVTGTIMYSSGTTGPSKGVMLSQGYYSTLSFVHIDLNGFQSGNVIYCVQPLCHVDARSAVIAALRLRGRIHLGVKFSATRFWDEVEAVDADIFYYVGTMIHLIYKQPARGLADPQRRRTGIGSATPEAIHRDFEERFNVELIEGYGMTEFGVMVAQRQGETSPGHIGGAPSWVDLRVVDETDNPVPDGVTGQLVARPMERHLHMQGYWARPEATVEAWRGLWFHTGDLVRRREDGNYEYLGRIKDSIRRRGENVSAWEVEEAACRHSAVLEAAAIGVPSDLGDEDVALLVVQRAGVLLDPRELRDFIAKDVPRFAVPRYLEFVDSLPKTPSERIAKAVVRERGLTQAAYDAEDPIHQA